MNWASDYRDQFVEKKISTCNDRIAYAFTLCNSDRGTQIKKGGVFSPRPSWLLH